MALALCEQKHMCNWGSNPGVAVAGVDPRTRKEEGRQRGGRMCDL